MNKQARSRKFSAKQSARLGAYLAAGLGAAAVATPVTDAAIVNINIGPSGLNIGGVNAGLSLYNYTYRYFPDIGQGLLWLGNQEVFSVAGGAYVTGLALFYGGVFATDSAAYASPTRFALNAPINGSSNFTNSGYTGASFFKVAGGDPYDGYFSYSSPNFGPGSYMGFKTANNSFGWLEVTWNGTDFEILSGAYETDPGVAILAGQGAAVPEPGTWAAAALLAGGAAFARWRKRRDEAQKEAA
jgi:hypothetical protein